MLRGCQHSGPHTQGLFLLAEIEQMTGKGQKLKGHPYSK